ncbi:MAG: CAP domain-containing protein [Myxococcota bacterium]|nr:CAP domain-containing protein [Myxococcota bacterium]
MTCILGLMLAAASCQQNLSGDADEAGEASSAEEAEEAMVEAPKADGPPVWESFEPAEALATREALVGYLNEVRSLHTLEPVSYNDALDTAAAAHAEYIMKHKATIDAEDLSIHIESADLEGFTGENFVERGVAAGYEGKCFGEVVAFKPTAVGAVRSWLESLYHRFPLLDADAVHIGYAEVLLGDVRVNVLELGRHD